jgi:hypothetical protein
MPNLPTALQRFQAIVLQDDTLQAELRECPDRATFIARAVECARDRSCVIEPKEIEAALNASAQAWLLSWMQR